MSERVVLTVILVSNQGAIARQFIEKFANLSRGLSLELVVVHDGASEPSQAPSPIISNVIQLCALYGGKIGLLRNIGVEAASGISLYFLDDDCSITTATLERAIHWGRQKSLVRGKINFLGDTLPARTDVALREDRYSADRNVAYAPNLVVNKDKFDSLGRFDERFFFGSDGEFSDRVLACGENVLHDEQMVIDKRCDRRVADLFCKSFRYGIGRYLRYRISYQKGYRIKLIPFPERLQGSWSVKLLAYATLMPRAFGVLVAPFIYSSSDTQNSVK